MQEHPPAKLKRLGRRAAEEVAGAEAVRQVEVEPGADTFGRPVYVFSFLIDQHHARQRAGLIRTRLIQKLHDALTELGDEHLPAIQILDRVDWDRRKGA